MEDLEFAFYIWSTKMMGWATVSGTYSSELKLAQKFSFAEAIARCKAHYEKGMDEFGNLPVRISDLTLVTK